MKIKLLLLLLLHTSCFAGHSYCKPGPLYCGAWSVAARAGASPSSYSNRDKIWWTIPPNVRSPGRLHKFCDQFHIPWEVDGELGFNFSIRVMGFLQYQFQQGGGRRHRRDLADESWSRYQTHAGYLGMRYYYNGCCSSCYGRIAPFIGFKTGLMWRRSIVEQISVDGAAPVRFEYARSRIALSGGLQAGLEWWMTWYWTLIFQIDGIITQGLETPENVTFSPALANGVTNLTLANSGVLFSFPITVGMRFTF